MTLRQAYMILRDSTAPPDQQGEAFKIVFDVLKARARALTSETHRQDELASIVLVKLVEARTSIQGEEDPQVQAYLGRAVKNAFLDQEKRAKRETEFVDKDDVLVPPEGQDLEDSFQELVSDSEILRNLDSPDPLSDAIDKLVAYLRDTVVADFRSDAVAKSQEALDQMLQLTRGEVTYEELVAELVAATDTTPAKARQLIHQRHSRTRERVLERLDKYELDKSDLQLLEGCIKLLRVRKETGGN